MGTLDGKTAIITGAGRGIGRGIAEKFIAEGARVVIADLVASTQTAEELGGSAIGIEVDVTSRESVQTLVSEAVSAYGRVDILVNNAGWDKAEQFTESSPDDWRRAIDINLYGVLNTCHVVLPLMIDGGGGRVVNLASDAGRVGSSGESVYAAAKGGVIAFSKTIARETARHGINVNCVSPGPTDTALFDSVTDGNEKLREALIKSIPFRRLGQPSDLANAVAFLASDEAGYITGQTLSVSGGLSMAD